MVAVGWHLYDLTGSAWDLGLVGLLQFLPSLALMLVVGQVVDRFHRARIVALCMAVQGGVAPFLVALLVAAVAFAPTRLRRVVPRGLLVGALLKQRGSGSLILEDMGAATRTDSAGIQGETADIAIAADLLEPFKQTFVGY